MQQLSEASNKRFQYKKSKTGRSVEILPKNSIEVVIPTFKFNIHEIKHHD